MDKKSKADDIGITQLDYVILRQDLVDSENEVDRYKDILNECASAIHYPDCWDTAAYPAIEDALKEAAWALGCSCKECMK